MPLDQIPEKFASIEGNWDANTNTPTLIDGTGDIGEIYVVSVAGTQDLGSGSQTFDVGDWVIYNTAGEWKKTINSTAVTSVNGQTGAVSLDLDDLTDVDLTTTPPVTGQGLIYDGVDWVPGEAGGSGTGSRNYALNPNAEIDASDQNVYDDGAVSEPVDGTGGTASVLSVARTTTASEILSETASFKVSKTAADGQGEGIELGTENIDPYYQGKRLQVSFKYKMLDANYADGDIKLFVYDVTNATLIGALENDDNGDLLAHTGEGATFIGWFNAASNSTDYRILAHQTSTSATATDWVYDDVVIGPAGFVPVNVMEDWVSYTPVASNLTTTTLDGRWRRVGDTMHLRVYADVTSAAAAFTVSIPSGYTIDTSKFPNNTTGTFYGSAVGVDASANLVYHGTSYFTTPTTLGFYGPNASRWTTAVPFTWAAGDTLSIELEIPIAEWSGTNVVSNTQLTQQTLKVQAIGNGGGAITANVTDIDFTEVSDPFNAWSGTAFVAPYDGVFSFSGSFALASAISAAFYTYINGSLDKLLALDTSGATGNYLFSAERFLNKGDSLTFRCASTTTLSNNPPFHHLSITSRPDFTNYGVLNPNTQAIESAVALTNYTIGASTWGDLTSIDLTPGEWDIDAFVNFFNNGAVTGGNVQIGVSTTSGASGAGLTIGDNSSVQILAGTTGYWQHLVNPTFTVTITSDTTYYFKSNKSGAITNLQFACKIRARKVK